MNWTEYARVVAEFKKRIGGRPPSIFTEQGAIDYMKRLLAELSAKGGQPNIGHPAKRD
ncbi:MAG TPA: hypothetical protein VGB82_06100 [Alphaproteobacteria bacterium]